MVIHKSIQSFLAWARLTSLVIYLLLSSCGYGSSGEGATERRQIDENIGSIQSENYRFESTDGLLHVIKAEGDTITLRASSPEFSFTLEPLSDIPSAAKIRIGNILSNTELTTSSQLAIPVPVPLSDLHLGYEWILSPTEATVLTSQGTSDSEFEVLAFGDIQNGIFNFDEFVDQLNHQSNAKFVLMLGDLTSSSSVEQFERVASQFDRIEIPIYSVVGNHDVGNIGEYQARFGRANFSFNFLGVRFTGLDTASGGLDSTVWIWLEKWLTAGANQVHIVMSHIPVTEYFGIRHGQWNSRMEANQFISKSAQYGVDLFLFGHIHSFDQYELAGIPTYVSGGAGAFPESFDSIGRHFLKIKISSLEKKILQVTRIDID